MTSDSESQAVAEGTSIFISHSHNDSALVDALQTLFRLGLRGLRAKQILASSIEELQLSPGAQIENTLKSAIADAKVLIAVLSPSSLDSQYVMFELGARWGAGQRVFPLLVHGVRRESIAAPLRNLHLIDSTDKSLYRLVEEVAKVLDLDVEPKAVLETALAGVRAARPGYEALRYAVLSYVIDKDDNFALLKDEFYGRIQPPGRKLQRNERPHEVAKSVVVTELDLPRDELRRFPAFHEQYYDNTRIVAPPYQVQVEKNPHRTALVHYDFVYVFTIDRVRPRLGPYGSPDHKIEPDWYSISDVSGRVGHDWPPHEDMLPTMEKILDDLGSSS